jgi:hypothetical protein
MARKKQIELTVAELMNLYRDWHKHYYRFDPDCHGGITMGLRKALLEAHPKGIILVPGEIE